MSRLKVVQRLELAVARAAKQAPSIPLKRLSTHTFRHTTAMHLLQSGKPLNVITPWLGHNSVTAKHRCVEADLAIKEKVLPRLDLPDTTLHLFKAINYLPISTDAVNIHTRAGLHQGSC